MFITSGTQASPSTYANHNDSDSSSSWSELSIANAHRCMHDDKVEEGTIRPGSRPPITTPPSPPPPLLEALQARDPHGQGPWQEAPIKELTSLTSAQNVYTKALKHSPRHGRKVVQAALINAAGIGMLAQQPLSAVSANKALNVAALMLRDFLVDLGQKTPDRFTQDIQKLFFNMAHTPLLGDCYQYKEACAYQGILTGIILAGLSKIPAKTKGLGTDTLSKATDAFGAQLNSVLGRSRLFQRHMKVLWPTGQAFAKAISNPNQNTREGLYRFVATIEDFMIASDIFDAREFNNQMLKTLRHCMA